jgi:putative membrane protein
MKLKTIATLALGALCLSACSSSTTSPSRQVVNNQVVNTATSSAQARSDAEILGTLVVLNKNEMMAARDAKRRAVHPSVQNYAAFMYKEHRNNLQATESLSHKLKVKPNRTNEVATMLQQQGNRQLNTMNRVKDGSFDRTYMDAMVKDHTEALNLVDGFYNLSTNGLIRNQLKVTRAHIAEHLKMAKAVQAELH